MKKYLSAIICSFSFLLILLIGGVTVRADEAVTVTGIDLTYEAGNHYIEISNSGDNNQGELYFTILVTGNGTIPVTVTAKNSKIITVESMNLEVTDIYGGYNDCFCAYTSTKCGLTQITVTAGNLSQSFYVFASGDSLSSSIVRKNHNTATLSWKKSPGASGYQIYCFDITDSEYSYSEKVIKVEGESVTSYDLTGEYGRTYVYAVCPYLVVDSETTLGLDEYSHWYTYYTNYAKYTYTKPAVSIKSITAGANGKATLKWAADSEVSKYSVYVATSKTGTYKKVKTTKGTSYTYSGKAGQTYYFKLRAAYSDITITSDSTSVYLLPKTTAKTVSKKLSSLKMEAKNGQYSFWANWSCADTTYMYEKSGLLHIVCLSDTNLYDYTLTKSNAVKSAKKIKLGKFDVFGAFYYGQDGRYYVAVGYNNYKESKKKTVIKVYQYNSKWEKLKTASIKGSASNSFEGIYSPFDGANCRMDMTGSTLLLFTGRTMFAIDGVNHQSNIGFAINTKTMKAEECNLTYTSHSFNQFIRANDGDVYQLDHGDAHSRAVKLTITKDYGKSSQSTASYDIFDIEGIIGDNYTGLKLGGLEVGAKNIITAGISVPQGYTVKGVTGSDSTYCKNVFICITDKNTGANKIKWITTYNPKSSTTTVSECRLVKISSFRFALLYTTTKNEVSTLNYVLIDNSGKVLCRKTYKNMAFTAGVQPIVHNGSICWTDIKYIRKKVTSYGWTYYESVATPYLFSVPIVEK